MQAIFGSIKSEAPNLAAGWRLFVVVVYSKAGLLTLKFRIKHSSPREFLLFGSSPSLSLPDAVDYMASV